MYDRRMSAPDGLCGPGLGAWLEPRFGERVLEVGPETGNYTGNSGLMVGRRSGARLGCFARVDRTVASCPGEPELR
jgi:hypothetical protein